MQSRAQRRKGAEKGAEIFLVRVTFRKHHANIGDAEMQSLREIDFLQALRDAIHFCIPLRALRLCVMLKKTLRAQRPPANCCLYFSFATSLRLCGFARDCILIAFLCELGTFA